MFPLLCRLCGAEMRIVAFITDASTIRDILVHRGNPAGRANVRSWQKRTSVLARTRP